MLRWPLTGQLCSHFFSPRSSTADNSATIEYGTLPKQLYQNEEQPKNIPNFRLVVIEFLPNIISMNIKKQAHVFIPI